MALTRSFKNTLKERAAHDAEFRKSLLEESVECMLGGDMETGKSMLRDYINITVGFEELGALSGKSPKSIMRMFSSSGNPTANNLFRIIQTLQEREGVIFKVRSVQQ